MFEQTENGQKVVVGKPRNTDYKVFNPTSYRGENTLEVYSISSKFRFTE